MTAMTASKITRSQLKRAAIIAAAKSAFKKYGVKGTSMDKLAELAQVSKRTVYNHFDSKEALVMCLVTDLWQKTLVETTLDYDAQAPLDQQLFELIKTEIDLMASQEYIDLSRVAIGHFFYSPESLQREIEKISCQETALLKCLKRAVEDQRLKIDDVDFANTQLHNLIKGSCFWPQIIGMQAALDEQQRVFIATESVKIFIARYGI